MTGLQALIACRRYPDAAIAADRLHAGTDKLYLQAQVLWRQSDIAAAAQLLSDACQQFPCSSKCLELHHWVESLQQDMHVAHIAFEDGTDLLTSLYVTDVRLSHHALLCVAASLNKVFLFCRST